MEGREAEALTSMESMTGSDINHEQNQLIEQTTAFLEELMASVMKDVEKDCLETAISLLQDALKNESYDEEGHAVAQSYLIKALLTRYGIYMWIEDLDACEEHLSECSAVGSLIKFLSRETYQSIKINEVHVASELIQVCRSSLDVETLDTVICVATDALSSYSNNTSGLRIADLLIILGDALVLKFLTQGGPEELDQATPKLELAERICRTSALDDGPTAYVCLTTLAYIEWLKFIDCRDIGGLFRVQGYTARTMSLDEEGSRSADDGIRMMEGAVDDAQLQAAIAVLRTSLACRAPPHPRRLSSLHQLSCALSARFERLGTLEDLEECVMLRSEALHLRPAPHPAHSIALNNLASSLCARFKHLGEFQDLEECITLHREALDLRPAPHPARFSSLNNLTNALSIRFKHKGESMDHEECIALHREALNLLPSPHPQLSLSLNNLASALYTRFERKGEFQDLEECIILHRKALELRPVPHPDRYLSLKNLASALHTLLERNEALCDFGECIRVHQEALDVMPTSLLHSDRSSLLNNLAIILYARFQQNGALRDLEQCMVLHREALRHRLPSHHDCYLSLTNLANALCSYYQQKGAIQDLEECISLHREAFNSLPTCHPDRSSVSSNLACSLSIRFQRKGAISDLEESIALHQEALAQRLPPHQHRSISLNNLANALSTRFEQEGSFKDLDASIDLHREALALCPTPHPDRSISLNNLANNLSIRFEQKLTFEDLEESILLHQEALDLQPPPHPERFSSMSNLAHAFSTRFGHNGSVRDLEEAISLYQTALDLQRISRPDRFKSLNNLALGLFTRFGQSGEVRDLDECIALFKKALDLLPALHPNRSGPLHNLARALSTRFDQMGPSATEDLEECISLCQEALDLLPAPHPDRAMSLHHLVNALSSRYKERKLSQDIEKALDYHEEAARYSTASVINRIAYSRDWAACAQTHRPSSALDAYNCCMELLPYLVSVDLTVRQRQDVLGNTQQLVGDAAKCAIDLGHYNLAIVFLSTARSIFWSQALQLRTPIDKLAVDHPELAKEFNAISRQLERASYARVTSSSCSSLESTESVAGRDPHASLFMLLQRRQEIIEKIREIRGFEQFLLPPTLSQLQATAESGPIVILNRSRQGCDALIMRRTGPIIHVSLLNIDLDEFLVLRKLLYMLPSELGATSQPINKVDVDVLQELLGRDLHLATALNLSQDPLRLALECLWVRVAHPVIKALGINKARRLSLETDSPDRIWWCPTGPFASLPIHAAGKYSDDNDPVDCLFHYVISSYCNTPQDLLHPSPKIARDFRTTVIIEPEAPGATSLPATRQELEVIKKHSPNLQHLIPHVGSKEAPTQVEFLLSDIQQSSLVHFGCHGIQSLKNPLENYLLLSGGKLTMVELMEKCQVSEGALAYLSACETARGNERRLDDSLNLVATLMFVGFRSVVGTLWSIADDEAPIVADVFYRHMFRRGKVGPPDVRDAAYGLHLATKELRDRGHNLWSWVPYVHYGI